MKRMKIQRKKPDPGSLRIAFRIALGVVLLLLVFGIIYLGTEPASMRLYEGDISMKDIYAPYDFTYTGELDKDKIAEAEREALESVRRVYVINPRIQERIEKSVSDLFGRVRDVRQAQEVEGGDEKVKALEGAASLSLPNDVYRTFIKTGSVQDIEAAINATIGDTMPRGVISASDRESLQKEGIDSIVILNPADGTTDTVKVSSVKTLDEVWGNASEKISARLPKDKGVRDAANEIVKTLFSSNLLYGEEETQKRRAAALKDVPNIYRKISVKKNEILIGKGEKVAKRHLNMLAPLGKMREMGGRVFYLIGVALLLIIFLVITVIHLRFYESKFFKDNKNLILISISTLFIVLSTQAIVSSPFSSYLIPLASASMLLAILLDAHSAFIFTVIMSIFAGLVAGNNYGLVIVMFIGGSVGIYSVRKVRRRSKLLIAGCLVGTASALTITALNFLNNIDPLLFLPEAGQGLLNGILCFFLAFGFLPILEFLFKIPTGITLLELSDLNHPLLKEMATKAPGTYHHSLIVGNLAEHATDAIGANTLLARVGAYYHDIGKIEKAEYFSENEGDQKNSRHDSLTPSMSALIIINHVKDGVELARKHKLNQALVDFIAQHHGNGLIYYFYQRALERVEDEKEIDEEAFRYPGPKPQSKETAIVLLADSVEASSRTLVNPTPSRVRGLVQRIVNNKFIDGQLDECDLTLKDLHKISESFVRILNAMFHTRVEYPDEEETKAQRASKGNGKKHDRKADAGRQADKKDSGDNAGG